MKQDQPPNDETMARALRAGDECVLAEILRTKGALVEQALRGRLPALQAADIDEVLSTALLNLWNRRDRFDPAKASIGVWFYLLARNAAIDLLRARHKLTPPKPSIVSIETRHVRAAHEALMEILNELSEADRKVVLSYVDWGSQSEKALALAQELNTTPGNIRTRQSRLLKKIRTDLAARGFPLEASEGPEGEPT